jgi:hypothetical protein
MNQPPLPTSRLRDVLHACFNDAEFRTLCADLGIDYEDLAGGAKPNIAAELVGYLQRRGRIQDLITICSKQRPHVNWAELLKDVPSSSLESVIRPTAPRKRVQHKWRWIVTIASGGILVILVLVYILSPKVHCASSSYQSDPGYCWRCTCENAFDNNPYTRWASVWTDNEWIVRDLGRPESFDMVALQWEVAYGKAYTIDVSDNGVAWTPIYTQTNGSGGMETIQLPLTMARYVRMRGLSRGTSFGYSLFEFQIYRAAYRY